jgi:hypothetical protein
MCADELCWEHKKVGVGPLVSSATFSRYGHGYDFMRQNGFVCKSDLTLVWGGIQVQREAKTDADKTDKNG